MRLDQYLVEKGFFESRNKAKAAIDDGHISINDKIITKSSYDVLDSDTIKIVGDICPFVSRGGYKLLAAIQSFYLDFNGKTIVDIGASTGGFTDCALQNGAAKVYSIDVGTNQLAEKLRNDSRVISLEQTNIQDIPYFPEKIDYFVMDVSFVSIEYLMKDIHKFITDDNKLVCLIKPQFEVGKVHMKNGIVKERTIHINVIENIMKDLEQYGLGISKLIPSPILGGSGNKEFLCLIERNIKTKINVVEAIKE
ncbi:TlyA family RNA methyltransferase [Anaeroplasma bactoclasticum]|jgi:23S rRNA (cytidine1920-2'-O)/16S rRNA (cytidine1409-2'-O)-methyltransferase|nr:TlyA family RNA methyltransferase [Anaeroplasma bactoclasticum]